MSRSRVRRRGSTLALAVACGALMIWPPGASAATCNFADAGSGLWHDAANWSCGHIPTTGDTAVVGSGDNVTVDQADGVGSLSLDAGTITVINNSTLSVSVLFSARSGTVTGTLASGGIISVQSTGSFLKATSGTLTVQGADLVLNGSGSFTEDGAIALNEAGGGDPHLRIRKDFTISGSGGFPSFQSSFPPTPPFLIVEAPDGNLIKSGTETSTVNSGLDNDDQVTTQAGTLELNGGTGTASSAGTYSTASGATTEFSTNPVNLDAAGGTITGAGLTRLGLGTEIDVPSGAAFTPGSLSLDGGAVKNFGGISSLTLASLTVTSGTLDGVPTTTVAAGGSFATGPGTLNLNTGSDLVLNAAGTIAGSVCLEDGTFSPNEIVQVNATLTLESDGGFTCSGNPSTTQLFINGPNGQLRIRDTSGTVDARTAVSGSAVLETGQSLITSNGFELATGGVLTGGGQVSGNVNNTAGTVRPGSSPGTLTLDHGYTQGPAGTLEVEVDGTASTAFDVLDVNGAAALDGTLKVIQGPFEPDFDDVFPVLTSASRTGTFATLDGPPLPNGKTYQVTYPGAPNFGAQLELVPPPTNPPPNNPPPNNPPPAAQTPAAQTPAPTPTPNPLCAQLRAKLKKTKSKAGKRKIRAKLRRLGC